MDLLLDTHTLLWFFSGDPKLSETAKQVIIGERNKKFVSIGSVWEVAIKISLKKLFFDGNTTEMFNLIDANGFNLLPIDRRYMVEIEKMPFIHRDPFDRLIVATAIVEKMSIVTVDPNIKLYPVNTIW
ncbi:twitching motility protein PilT [Spirochaetia bacterium]|nr:twitching motility protein PilT [Spirochaetia bacterium]